MAILFGNGADNTIFGTSSNDLIFGFAGDDLLIGNDGSDILVAGAGRDLLFGGVGNDTLRGELGDDSLSGGVGIDTLSGGLGQDLLNGGLGADVLDGGLGVDTASYVNSAVGVEVFLLFGWGFEGDAEGDTLIQIENVTGSSHDDNLQGNIGANTLIGGAGDDLLAGNAGNDRLVGGAGADFLSGGPGADRYIYTDIADSVFRDPDRIDFNQGDGDRVDLSAIDADTTAVGNQAFTFIGAAAFSGQAGELRFLHIQGPDNIQGDVDGDGHADFRIDLYSDVLAMTAADFIL
ncbi:calcium-binding protein [Inquilinus sp. CA228]|uniref:calcium-binding protein n=1 Tax=Inquilinus sp. CA228 TaxID=3455609 RepID=UPI003F8CF74A